MVPAQSSKFLRRPFDDLVDRCALTIIPKALATSGCLPVEKQLGPMLGMAHIRIHNRQALRMWIRWRLAERRIPPPQSDSEFEAMLRRMWLGLLPMLLRIKAASNEQADAGSGPEPFPAYGVHSVEEAGEIA